MPREETGTWGVVGEESEDDDAADSNSREGLWAGVIASGVSRRLLAGVLGLVGLSVLLAGAYTATDPVVLSLLFLVAPAFLLLVVFGFLRGGDLIDPRV